MKTTDELLNLLPPRLSAAIWEVQRKTGAPIEMVIIVALSAMSAALHGMALRTPDNNLMPLALYCFGLGPRLCGKSSAMREFYKAIKNFDSLLTERRSSSPELQDHPAFRDLLLSDAAWSPLLVALDGRGHGLTIVDDDCYDLLKSDIMKKRGKLNRFFDGACKETLLRRGYKPVVAYDSSVGLIGLTQPEIYDDYLRRTRNEDLKTGLASRIFYAHTMDGCGPKLSRMQTPNLDEIHILCEWFLEQRLQRWLIGNTDRLELRLSPEAEALWEEIKQDIDRDMTDRSAHDQDAVGRATEKTWRIATMLQCFAMEALPDSPAEPLPSMPPVTPEAIFAAWGFVQWSMAQFDKVFPVPKPELPRVSRVQERQLEEARSAKDQMYRHLRTHGVETITHTHALELSGLSAHKFRTVVARMKSRKQVEELGGSDSVLRFTSHFFAEMGYQATRPAYGKKYYRHPDVGEIT